jgi:prepilin-type processing-associated H-X9-DG protein
VQTDLSTTNIEAGVLFKYNKSVAIYVCPSDRFVIPKAGMTYPTTRSYSMVSTMPPAGGKLSTLADPKPSRALVFMDEQENFTPSDNYINDGNIGLRMYPTRDWGDSPGRRHRNGATVSIADGHAEAWKWKSSRKVFSRGLFFPDELPDLIRIQQGLPGFPNL